MPLLLALVLIVAAFVFAVVMLPFTLLFRYRSGTRRRRARVWVATLNAASLAISATIFLISAAITTRFIAYSFTLATFGLACGAILGLLGLVLTRWERDGQSLFYTPSRLLVLAVTLVVTLRIAYGFWRGWHTWRAAQEGTSWIAAIGIPGSLAAGAVVIGYYLVYWAGVRSRTLRVTR
ncbi:MAG TPA: DUF1453 domain-containing protein [Thermoanaerobaculia bacterium]|jgi:hypothetical protein|nr:DUF1453 domain-containing protein [Thermoanaerobaculia bacterium]